MLISGRKQKRFREMSTKKLYNGITIMSIDSFNKNLQGFMKKAKRILSQARNFTKYSYKNYRHKKVERTDYRSDSPSFDVHAIQEESLKECFQKSGHKNNSTSYS